MSQQTLLGGDGTTGETGATHNSKANSNFTELYAATAAAQADADAAQSSISTHISANPAHSGANISFTPVGSISSTNVQDAIAEVAVEAGAIVPDATTLQRGIIELATAAEVITGTDTEKAVVPADLHAKVVGVFDIWIPAGAMIPRATGGCGVLEQYEEPTNKVNFMGLPFDQTTQEYAQFNVQLPRRWDNGTITFLPLWTAITGSGTVRWTLKGGAYSNDDPLSTALGTAQSSDDTLTATYDVDEGAESSAITIAGIPASRDLLFFEISRDVANDNLSADAILMGITIRITTSAAKDA